MQENEKYGIELEAKTNLFKKGLQEAIKYTKAFGKGVKESFNEQVAKSIKGVSDFFREDFGFFDKDYSKRIEYIKDEMDAVMDQINAIKEGGKEGNLEELEAEYDRLTKKLEFFTEKQSELNDELEETDSEAYKTKTTLSSLFDGSISKIKRFTYYLLGARSVFSLFMKYRSAYYQFNEEMQYQSELSQNALALSLGPAFEFLGNIITYASIALAKFIELLTDVPVLAKVTTKGIRDYNKSLKETQTLVSGIDEITNLTNPQNLGLASQYQALADFQKKIEEVEKFFAENQWITDLAEGLKEVWRFIKENILPILKDMFKKIGGVKGALILLGGVAVMGAIAKVIGVAGAGAVAGTGLAGIAGLLTFIAGVHVIKLVLEGKEEFDKLKQDRLDLASNERKWYAETLQVIIEDINQLQTLDKNSKEYKSLLTKINQGWIVISRAIQSGDKEVLNNIDDAEELAQVLDDITNTDTYTKSFDVSKSIGLDQANELSKSFWQKWAGWFTNQDEIDEKRKKKYLDEFDEYEKELGEIEKDIKDIDDIKLKDKNGTINYDVKANTSKADTSLSSLYRKFNIGDLLKSVGDVILNKTGIGSVIKSIGNTISSIFTPHAKGLDFVPYDNYPALLHKGEAVVPAKYNPTIHSQGNDYTNSLLETLIVKMDDLASRPNVFEVDGQQFAQATYNLYDSERKRQGYVEGVVR